MLSLHTWKVSSLSVKPAYLFQSQTKEPTLLIPVYIMSVDNFHLQYLGLVSFPYQQYKSEFLGALLLVFNSGKIWVGHTWKWHPVQDVFCPLEAYKSELLGTLLPSSASNAIRLRCNTFIACRQWHTDTMRYTDYSSDLLLLFLTTKCIESDPVSCFSWNSWRRN